jgi:hypothetical protein
MLPKTHIILGFIFTLVIYLIFPQIILIYLALIFLASFLIDFDHYVAAIKHTKSFSLSKAFNYYIEQDEIEKKRAKKGIREKGDFHIFHTFEFLLFVYLMSFLWTPLIYVFIGMIFHSLLDIVYMIDKQMLYRREFFLINWIKNKLH